MTRILSRNFKICIAASWRRGKIKKSISFFLFSPEWCGQKLARLGKICKTGHHQAHWPLGRFPANAPLKIYNCDVTGALAGRENNKQLVVIPERERNEGGQLVKPLSFFHDRPWVLRTPKSGWVLGLVGWDVTRLSLASSFLVSPNMDDTCRDVIHRLAAVLYIV